MGEVVDLDDYREYILVCVDDEVFYRLPVALLKAIIDGHVNPLDVRGWEDMLPAILDNWLELVEEFYD